VNVSDAIGGSTIDRREARLLLAEAGGFSEASILAYPERQLSPEAAKTYHAFVSRRAQGEPVAYILGRKEFYGLELVVNRAVLIPRPETELLVDLALQRPFHCVADIGTGSGAIALAIKRHRPEARVVAGDASAAALSVAKLNAAKLSLEVEFRHGRWLEPFHAERFDLIVSNPPYVAQADPHLADLRYEPTEALLAGADGLEAICELVRQGSAQLAEGGWLLIEHGAGQERSVRKLLDSAGLGSVASWPDLAGIPRVSGGKR
jgi:release factor glutamine methyltransferase